jgi:hypothetical protein
VVAEEEEEEDGKEGSLERGSLAAATGAAAETEGAKGAQSNASDEHERCG